MSKQNKILIACGAVLFIIIAVLLVVVFTKKQEPTTYRVTFDSNGGSIVREQLVTEGEKATKPQDPTKDGHIFKGWYLNDEEFNFDKEINENIEINAKWEKEEEKKTEEKPKEEKPKTKKYTITFNSNGGSSINSQTVEEGQKAQVPGNPTRDGFEFTGWTLNGNAYDFNTEVKGNITLTATWKEIVKNNYTVTFDSKGGSAVSPITVQEGNKISRPQDPAKEGHTFTGWTLNGSNYNFDNAVNGNITLSANWAQKTYTIKATKADAYSPDAKLSVYENGTQITVKSIKYSDGTLLCNGTNTTVGAIDIEGETSFIVVLNGGTEVRATLQ